MAKRYRYAFAKKREAQQGKLSAVLAAVSLVLFVTAVLLAFFLQGQYGYIVGGISLCAMLLSVYGFAMGLKSFSDGWESFCWEFPADQQGSLIEKGEI